MLSADTGFFCLRVLFIELLLLSGCLPQSHKVPVFSFLVFTHLKYKRVQPFSHPTDRSVLLWYVRTLFKG
jgi:hypothetical protein